LLRKGTIVADVIAQIYGIRNVEDARMVIDMGGEHIGVSYGKIKRTPGQLDCERAREIFEGVQPQAVRIGLTVAEDIDEISENLREAMPDVLHLSGDIEGISPAEVAELKSRFPELKIMQAIPVLAGVPLGEQKVMQYVKDYEPVSDFFLIDTKSPAAGDIGATGLTHDRAIDRAIIEATDVPCIIAGGLDASNVAEAIYATHPYGVDSFSLTNYDDDRADTDRCKDPAKVEAFIKAAKDA
jgi:phosphoribosylanthranilate isomerase